MTKPNWNQVLFALVGVVLVGCGPSKSDQLKVKAASDMACQDVTITAVPGFMYYEKASGCGKEVPYLYDRSSQKWVSALDRASFEMSCERTKLKAIALDAATVGVEGCGQKNVYKIVAGVGWVLDSAAKSAPAPSAAPDSGN